MIEHREPDPRDDIYALGCITYELLTGHHPFDRLSATQARNADFKPQRPPNVDAKQWRALRAALSFDRNTRMPSVVRFIAEFDNEARAEKSGTLVKVGFASFAVVCAAVVGVFALRSGPSRHSGDQQAATVSGASADQAAAASSPLVAATAASAPEQASSVAPIASSIAAAIASAAPPVAPPAPKPSLTLAAVTSALAQVPCSALSASTQDHALTVRGYVSQRYGTTHLKDTLAALPGVDTLTLQTEPLADDKCDTIKALAPYWTRNWQAGHVASLHVRPPGGQLSEGEPLVVDVTTPAYDSYVNLDYYQLDGSVVHMVPSPRAKDNQAPPRYAATVGSGGDWIISKPFGSEMVVLLITPVPLFDKPRPESESRADYLRALETRLAQIGGKLGQDHIVADFAPITTTPRAP
jgi:hypothetical protein